MSVNVGVYASLSLCLCVSVSLCVHVYQTYILAREGPVYYTIHTILNSYQNKCLQGKEEKDQGNC